jgi:hypothetical protein
MAGKAYIKTGDYTWSRVKKVYLKTGGITWQAIRKAYIKTGTSTWKKVYDTASNKPFIGTDIPKIRLNTPRTNSTLDFTGTANDPVNPVVEVGGVQQMGSPFTTPTLGWPSTSIGNHLWGYNGGWISGNGSAISYIYQWLYNLTGNSNDNVFDPQFYVSSTTSSINTSSTGRADMLTNSADYLGYDDGDYFDKNFITFRVGASNSAGGPVFAESAPVYIVRKRPSGTIDLTNTNVDVPETLYANFSYSNQWWDRPDLYDSYIEWFAIDSASEALTASNRVEIQDLYTFSTTGTTTKSGTATYYAIQPNKFYAARLTLNNSNTQSAVIAVSGFTPSSPFTAEDSTAPGSALQVTSLDILDYYGNAGTDNRDYIPVGGLIQIRSQVTGVDGSSTYRIRYRMYNWQTSSYYGMDGTNYGSSAGSAWTTRTGSNTSFGFGGTLINEVTVSGNTATLNHREIVSSSLFGSTTYTPSGGTSTDKWSIDIEVSVLKNSIRKYYADLVGGALWYISRPAANLLLSVSPTTAQVNSNVTFSGSIGALGGGNSYPRQYKITYATGDDSGWLPVGEWTYGTNKPSFTVTKQFSTAGQYYPYFQTIPDYATGSTNIVISPALSAPTPTGVVWNGTSFVISYTGGSGPWFQSWYRSDNTTYPSDGTGYDSGSATQNTSTITYTPGFTPTPGSTYSFWVRSALESTSNTSNVNVSSYSATRVDVVIPAVATAPTSVTASNNGSSNTITVSWSGSTNAAYYRIYWTGSSTAPTDPGVSYDEQKVVNGSTITASAGSWAWGPGDSDRNNNNPSLGSSYYFYVSASANGTTWTPYVRTAGTTNLRLTPPTSITVTPGPQGGSVSATFSGGSGPNYQMFWWGTATAPTGITTPDQSGTGPTLTDNTGPTSTATQYMYVRSVATTTDTTAGESATTSAWSAGVPFNMTSTAVVQSSAPTARATSNNSSTTVKYGDSITWTSGTYTNQASKTSVLLYSTLTSNLVSPNGNTLSSFQTANPYTIQANDPTGTPYVFTVRDTVVGTNGTTYYFYSNQITSALADAVAFSYNAGVSAAGGWSATVVTAQSGASYSINATTGYSVNSSTGAVTVTGLGSNVSSSITVTKSVAGTNSTTAIASGTSNTVASGPTVPTGLSVTAGTFTATLSTGLSRNSATNKTQSWSTSTVGAVTVSWTKGTGTGTISTDIKWNQSGATPAAGDSGTWNGNSGTSQTDINGGASTNYYWVRSSDGNSLKSAWVYAGSYTVAGPSMTGLVIRIYRGNGASFSTGVATSTSTSGTYTYSGLTNRDASPDFGHYAYASGTLNGSAKTATSGTV